MFRERLETDPLSLSKTCLVLVLWMVCLNNYVCIINQGAESQVLIALVSYTNTAGSIPDSTLILFGGASLRWSLLMKSDVNPIQFHSVIKYKLSMHCLIVCELNMSSCFDPRDNEINDFAQSERILVRSCHDNTTNQQVARVQHLPISR